MSASSAFPIPSPPAPAPVSYPVASASSSSESGIQLSRDADLLISSFLPSPSAAQPPPPYEAKGLPLPFCAPQIAASFDSPFARGYNPTVESAVSISQDQLLAFIDGLNLAMTASPPLRVVNVAGKIIGYIPYHWAMIAGAVMQTVAQTGMHILSKTLTDRYLRAANLRLFKPRGLSVRLCTTSAMQHLVAHSGSGAGPSTLDKIGRGVGTVLLQVPIPIPFKSRIIRSIADHAAKVPANISGVGDGKKIPLSTQRRLAALAGQTLPLEFDVPPPAKVQGVMDTMGDWGVKFDAWRTGRKEAKAERRRIALARIEEQLHHTPYGLGYFGRDHYLVGRRERMDLRKAARMERKRNLGRDGLLSPLIGPRETKLERRVRNADLLEHWATDKVLWLVIMNSDQDKDIDGIEKAESLDDEERVDDKTWHTELAKEKDLLEEEAEEDEMDVQDDQKK